MKDFFVRTGNWIKYCWLCVLAIFTGRKPNKPYEVVEEDNHQEVKGSTMVFRGTDQLKKLEESAKTDVLNPPEIPTEELEGRGRGVPSLFKPRTRKPPFAFGVVIATSKVFFVAIAALVVLGVGGVLGVANAYLGTTPELDLEQINENDLTSYIYDSEGTLITSYAGMQNRDYAPLSEIPLLLQQAVISVEDVRFYYHNGVDIKGLMSSFFKNLSGSKISGGSTITQQLIKMQILSPERSYKRKIQEASLAMELEQKYTKDQILEAYLNSIPLGGTNYGVAAAAKDYFNKSLDKLTLREIACLAGVTQNPTAYNPRTCYYVRQDTSSLDARINLVLERMYKAGYINKEEYNSAVNDKLTVTKDSAINKMYEMPHFVEYAVYDAVTHLMRQRNLEDNAVNRSAVESELRTNGYHIYTTVVPEIQNQVQETLHNYKKYPDLEDKSDRMTKGDVIQPQAAAVVIDQKTGYLTAIVGGRTAPTAKKTLNRAYQSRMPVGSSIKPLTVYGPAMDLGSGLGTIIANIPAPIPGWNTKAGYPLTSKGKYGPVSIRNGIVSSLNIVAARTLVERVGVNTAYDYLVKLGVSTSRLNKDGVGMALGTSGITTIEMAGAYACIANGGEFIEPISFTKITDKNGDVILDAKTAQQTRRVFDRSTAYMLVDALQNAVRSGTGTAAKISGMTVAGKTGTNHDNRGAFFAGITPYYVGTLWVGHDDYKKLERGSSGGTAAAPLWGAFMSKVVDGLKDKPILEGSEEDYNVVKATVCAVSGLNPTSACRADTNGRKPISDFFAEGTVPTEECDMHKSGTICSASKRAISQYCPSSSRSTGGYITLPEGSPYLELSSSVLGSIFSNTSSGSRLICNVHTKEWADNQSAISNVIRSANSAIDSVRSFIAAEYSRLTDAQVSTLEGLISTLRALTQASSPNKDSIANATSALLAAKSSIQQSLPSDNPDPTISPDRPVDPDPSPSESGPIDPDPEQPTPEATTKPTPKPTSKPTPEPEPDIPDDPFEDILM